MSVFSAAELAGMQQTQEVHMNHRALFTPWQPVQDADSGQMVNGDEPQSEVICGVDYSARGALVDGTEGTFVAHYKVRLPREMAALARPLSRYEVVSSFGLPSTRPLVLEQVSEPAAGPSGIVVWARNVRNG